MHRLTVAIAAVLAHDNRQPGVSGPITGTHEQVFPVAVHSNRSILPRQTYARAKSS